MKRLILTRHAKSSWDDPLMSDHDRPLNERGKAAAADLGQWLASRGYVPSEVLCSDAVRTRATAGCAARRRASSAALAVMRQDLDTSTPTATPMPMRRSPGLSEDDGFISRISRLTVHCRCGSVY